MKLGLDNLYRLVFYLDDDAPVVDNYETVLRDIMSNANLTVSESNVLQYRWQLGYTLVKTAEILGLSETRISRIEQSALDKLWDTVKYFNDFNNLGLNSNVAVLHLSKRAYTGVKRAGISTIGELCSHTAKDFLKIRNCGPGSVAEIQEKLRMNGFYLREA